ncbi:MAG: hypothetical protein JO266_16105 [Acidobacteria bacterium]|nr:hypothetical protein [Acidobacteriota bacterium]
MPALILAGCVVCAGLILFEFGSISNPRPSSGTRSTPAEIEPAAPEIRKLTDPLVSPTHRHPETPSSANDAASSLRDVRLTGIVTGPDLRIAIFAVTGTIPLVLSEGEALKGWRLDSISPERVVLSGSAGNIVLKPKPDANLVRSSPPVTVQSDQREPDVPSGAAIAGASGQPMAVTPIAVGNLSVATSVQTQGYPYYFPEYYAGYDEYPWRWDWGYSWGWGWPIGVSVGFGGCVNCGFRGAFFHPGFKHFGFGHPGFSHPGFGHFGFTHAGFGGGFRVGGRR